jgi:hypothetical protein
MQGDAGHVILDFRGQMFHGQNELQKVHAADGVHLAQHAVSSSPSGDASERQDFDLTAPAIDFFVADGRRLDRAQTSGAAQITISPAQPESTTGTRPHAPSSPRAASTQNSAPTPEGASRLTSMHGAPDARIVSVAPGQPDRVSTSQTSMPLFSRRAELHPSFSRERRLHRRPAAGKTHSSLGQQSSLHSRRSHSAAHRQPTCFRRRHDDHRQYHSHQSRNGRRLRRRKRERAPTAISRSNPTVLCWPLLLRST